MARERGNDAERGELQHEMRSARAHKGYRRAGDGKEPETDAGVYRHVCGKENEHAEREKGVKVGRRSARDLRETRKKETVQCKQEYDADKSPLFCKRGEYKIGLVLG